MILRILVVLLTMWGAASLSYKMAPTGAITGFALGPVSMTWVMVVTLACGIIAFAKTTSK